MKLIECHVKNNNNDVWYGKGKEKTKSFGETGYRRHMPALSIKFAYQFMKNGTIFEYTMSPEPPTCLPLVLVNIAKRNECDDSWDT